MTTTDEGDAFDVFNDSSPKGGHPSAKLLFDYEKHYMNLLSVHKNDINFINNLLKALRNEQKESTERIIDLEKILNEQNVDEKVKNMWLKHLAKNMGRSFQLSNELISHFMIMKKDSFLTELQKRLEINGSKI